MDIGWIKYGSCIEGWGSSINTVTFNANLTAEKIFSSISIKILPSTDIPDGITENSDYSVKADICSNPVYALHNGLELSFQLDINNWIGSTTAINRLRNDCYHGTGSIGHLPRSISNGELYQSCGSWGGLHIKPNKIILWVLSILGGVIPSIFVMKSKFYRKDIFSLEISHRFLHSLFSNRIFLLTYILQTVIVLFISIAAFFIDNNIWSWSKISYQTKPNYIIFCILFFTFLFMLYQFYVFFKICSKYQPKQNHASLIIETTFDENQTFDLFDDKYAKYEQQFTSIIKRYIDPKTYFIETVSIKNDDKSNSFSSKILIEWDDNNDDALLKMENEFQQKLNDIHFAKNMTEFCNLPNDKIPKISIKGTYAIEHIFKYQIDKVGLNRNDILKQIEQDIINKYDKSLKEMTWNNINKIISYWILSDIKYQRYSDEIMKIIKTKNINGTLITEIIQKNINLKNYLNNLISEYIEDRMMNKITNKLKLKLSENVGMDSHSLAELICKFAIDTLDEPLYDNDNNPIDGEWIVNNIENNVFEKILQKILGINQNDSKQIYQFIKKYHVPSNEAILSEIISQMKSKLYQYIDISHLDETVNNMFYIDYKILALKIKNNADISIEVEIIANLFIYLIMENQTNKILNFGLITSLYELYAQIFDNLFLKEWFCSHCNYFNRKIKINGKMLTYLHKLMQNCLVCGHNKIKSIADKLKGHSIQTDLFHQNANRYNINCPDASDISKCSSYQRILKFMQKYCKNENIKYISIVSKINCESVRKYIICAAISNISNQMEKKLLRQIFENSQDYQGIDGNKLCRLEEKELIESIFEKNKNII